MSLNKTRKVWILAAVMSSLVLAACGGSDDTNESSATASSGDGGSSKTLSLVAFSTPQVVYDEAIPLFQQTPEGKGVKFKQSYGGSGDQSRAVEGGQKADIVHLSLAPDVERLVKADLVAEDWSSNAD